MMTNCHRYLLSVSRITYIRGSHQSVCWVIIVRIKPVHSLNIQTIICTALKTYSNIFSPCIHGGLPNLLNVKIITLRTLNTLFNKTGARLYVSSYMNYDLYIAKRGINLRMNSMNLLPINQYNQFHFFLFLFFIAGDQFRCSFFPATGSSYIALQN